MTRIPSAVALSRGRLAAVLLLGVLAAAESAPAQTFVSGTIRPGSGHTEDLLTQSGSFLGVEDRSTFEVLEQSPTRLRFRVAWVNAVDLGIATGGQGFQALLQGDARVGYVFSSPVPFAYRVTASVRGALTTVNDGPLDGNDEAEAALSDVMQGSQSLIAASTTRGPTTTTGATTVSASGSLVLSEGVGTQLSREFPITWSSDCHSRIVGLTGNGVECAARFGLEAQFDGETASDYPGIGNRTAAQDGLFITLEIIGPLGSPTATSTATPTPSPTATSTATTALQPSTNTATPTATPTTTATPTPTPTFTATVAIPAGLSVNDVAILEGDTGTRSAIFTVSLRGRRSAERVTVLAATTDGTATAPSDYRPQSATLTFASNEDEKRFAVLISGDRTFEPDETFSVALSNAVGAPIGDALGVGTILTDEGLSVGVPALSPADPLATPGALTILTLRWQHPERWRALNTVDLRLVDDDLPVFWARFDEAANTIAPCDADGVCGSGFTPGSGAPQRGDLSTFHPADSAVQGSGPTGPSVDLLFAFSLDDALAGRVLRVETAATEDSGAAQGFLPVGYLTVAATPPSGAGADDDGCAIAAPRDGSSRGAGWLFLGLLSLTALRFSAPAVRKSRRAGRRRSP